MKSAAPSLPAQWMVAALGGVLCAGLGLLFLISPLGTGLSRRSFDLLQRWQSPPHPPEELVIVAMDDRSFVSLYQDPTRFWDRALHARLIRSLTEQGAKGIVFDVLFNAPTSNPTADLAMIGAMQSHGNLVIAAKVEVQTNSGLAELRQPLLPDESLAQYSSWGTVEYRPDSDGIIRQLTDPADYVSLGRQAAQQFHALTASRKVHAWLRFYGPAGTIYTVSYVDALTPSSLPPDWCRGKTVFVGHGKIIPPKHSSIPDQFPTPLGPLSGVEIQATTFANLLQPAFWSEASPIAEFLTILGLGLGLGLASRPRDIRRSVLLQLLLLVCTLAVEWFWLDRYRLWSPWLIPAAIQTPFAAAWTGAGHLLLLGRENRRLVQERLQLQRKLDSYPEHTPAEARLHTLSGTSSEQVSMLIPDYTLLKVIGSGAYGEVWLARSVVGSHVAIKILFRDRFDDAEPYEREFRGIKKFMSVAGSHPGWVHVLHVGRIDALSCFYYAMELADDASITQPSPFNPETYIPKSLRTMLDAKGPFTPAECIELGIALGEALAHLHQQGLIHRDIKPANVILVRGLPRFADVGLITAIAKAGEELTQVGTTGYIAPEGPGTTVADLYGFGKLLYVCLTGKAVRHFPEPPTSLYGGKHLAVVTGLNDIILKACDPNPSSRFKDASAMVRALEKLR